MTRRNINLVRKLEVPVKHDADNPVKGARKATINSDTPVFATGTITFTGAMTASSWPMTTAGIRLTNSAGESELYIASTSSVSGATFFTFAAGAPDGAAMVTSASGSAAGLHAVISASSSLGITLAAYTAGDTSISLTQNASGVPGNQTINASGSASELSATLAGFSGGSNTRVLTAADSGATIFLSGTTACTVELPVVAGSSGVWYNFMGASVHQHIIQDTEGSKIFGCVHHNSGSGVPGGLFREVYSGASRVRLHSSQAAVGDKINMWCNGTLWYVDGLTNAKAD